MWHFAVADCITVSYNFSNLTDEILTVCMSVVCFIVTVKGHVVYNIIIPQLARM